MKNLQNERQSPKREIKNQVRTVFLEVVSKNKIPVQISLEGSERRRNLNTQMVIQIWGHVETVFKYKTSKITAQ